MKITKQELMELFHKGSVEVKYRNGTIEYTENIEVKQ